MNNDASSSGSSPSPPRRNLLRHAKQNREDEAGEPLSEPLSDGLDLPSSSSLGSALARVNSQGESLEANEAALSPPGEEDFRMENKDRSSLPLALARANETRGTHNQTSQRPRDSVSEPVNEIPSTSLADFFFRFGRFADAIHPLRGWGRFSFVYVITILLLGQGLVLWSLPAHPGARNLTETFAFWMGYLGRSSGIGAGLTIMGALAALGFYGIGHGRPPFLWVFKLFVYTLAPLTLLYAYLILSLSDIGVEAYVRGYRPDSWRLSSQISFTATSVWVFVRFLQSGTSRHCQAKVSRMVVPLSLVLFLGVCLLWTQDYLKDQAYRKNLYVGVYEGEQLFSGGDPAAASVRLESLGREETPWWSHDLKVRFYLLRSEVRFLDANILGAREDAVRLVRMHPQGHPMTAFGRGLNLLALGQIEEATQLFERVAPAMDFEDSVVGRWLYRIRRGDYGSEWAEAGSAERHARQVYFLDPTSLHLEMLAEALLALEQDRRMVRELQEAERMSLRFTPSTALMGAIAAGRIERMDLLESWLEQALTAAPDLAEDPRAQKLRRKLTNHP